MYGSTAHKDSHPSSGGPGSGSPSTVSPDATHPVGFVHLDRAVLDQGEVQRRYFYQGSARAASALDSSRAATQGTQNEKDPDNGRSTWWCSCCPGAGDASAPAPRPSCSPAFCSAAGAMDSARSVFPIVDWLGRYRSQDLVGDLVAGFTVAVMHIPQGLAYALLGNVPPVVGIYMAFFPVLVYCLFGTSKHVSMGTFAVVCLMTGRIVTAHTHPTVTILPNGTDSGGLGVDQLPTPIEVASAVALVCGLIQLLMCALRLGVLTALLSESLVSGFTSAAAVHVLTSQLQDLLGLSLPGRPRGAFKVVLTWVNVCSNLGSANVAAVVVSLCTMILLTINNEILKPYLSRRCPLPVPIELIVVVAGTLLSAGPDAPLVPYQLTPLGTIPTGFPAPSPPSAQLVWSVAVESIPVAVVAYTIAMSMALIFATKNGYTVRPNQELLALGAANVAGSMFSCMPITASLSRSAVQEAAGGRTQLTSLVSCSLLTLVLLWAAPFFEPLPRCVLAAVIVVALRGMLLSVRDGPRFIRQSHWDGLVWLGTFLAVVLVDIDVGLGAGVALSLLALVCQSARPQAGLLAPLPPSADGLYADPKLYGAAQPLPGIAIVRFGGVLNFATRAMFIERLHSLVGVDPDKELARLRKAQQRRAAHHATGSTDNFVEEMKREELEEADRAERGEHPERDLLAVVLDLSGVVRVDPEGARALRDATDRFGRLGVCLYLAAPSDGVLSSLVRSGACGGAQRPVYPSLHDAVTAARAAATSTWTLALAANSTEVSR